MTRTRIDWIRWGVALTLIVFGWFQYRVVLKHIFDLIQAPIEDMTHAWVVPFVSLYALWRQRAALRKAAGLPSWRGLGWVCLFLAVTWFGSRGGQARINQVALIGLLWSVPYALWGRGVGRLALFPAWYLLFTVPVSSYLDIFTVHLRIFSSGMATGILNGFGMAIEQSGTAIFSRIPGAEFSVDVAEPCSGIRSLFAMMALTAIYAHTTLNPRFQRWALFACAIPIAVIGNMFRIFSICLVAHWFGQKHALGLYHDYSGYVIFVVGVLMMLSFASLVTRLDAWLLKRRILPGWLSPPAETEADAPAPAAANPRHALLITCLTAGLVIATFESNRLFPRPAVDAASFIADDLPIALDGYTTDRPWFCHDEQCNASETERALTARGLRHGDGFTCPACGKPMHRIAGGEKHVLPSDTTILKRNYTSPSGVTYATSVVISGLNRGSIHRAELCLPAQGFRMLKTETRPLNVAGGRPRAARVITAQSSATHHQFTLVYWFVSREHENASHAKRTLIDIWDRSIRNRINRWAMVSVNVSAPLDSDEATEAFEAFLGDFYPKIFRE